jgi:hypothetical protein
MMLQKDETWDGLHIWGADPKRPGYLRFVRMATMAEMVVRVETRLRETKTTDTTWGNEHKEPLMHLIEYLSWERHLDMDALKGMRLFKVYMVIGGSEGYYIHVDAMTKDTEDVSILTIKILTSETVAWDIVKALHKEFNRCD